MKAGKKKIEDTEDYKKTEKRLRKLESKLEERIRKTDTAMKEARKISKELNKLQGK